MVVLPRWSGQLIELARVPSSVSGSNTIEREPRIASRLVKRSPFSRMLWLDLCKLECLQSTSVHNPSTSEEGMDVSSRSASSVWPLPCLPLTAINRAFQRTAGGMRPLAISQLALPVAMDTTLERWLHTPTHG